MRRITYQDILDSEYKNEIYTRNYLRGANDNIPVIIDTLIQLMYFTGTGKDCNTPEGSFYSFCWYQCVQVPYSLRACFVFYEKGYYFEATFILRYLIEVLAKMRYLENHKDLTNSIWSNKKIKIVGINGKKKNLTIKDIFDEVAPCYYEKEYGSKFSRLLHAGIEATIFRVDWDSAPNGQVRMGIVWDEDLATYVINHFAVISYGYLNYFPKIFSEGFSKIDVDLLTQYRNCILWLEGHINDHVRVNPKSKIWYGRIEPLVK